MEKRIEKGEKSQEPEPEPGAKSLEQDVKSKKFNADDISCLFFQEPHQLLRRELGITKNFA